MTQSLEQRVAALEARANRLDLRGLRVTQTRAIFSADGDPLLVLGTAASTDTPTVVKGYTALRAHISGSTIVLEAWDSTNAAWRTVTLS